LREGRWPGHPGGATIEALTSAAESSTTGGASDPANEAATAAAAASAAAAESAAAGAAALLPPGIEHDGGECRLYLSLLAAVEAGSRDEHCGR